MKSDEILAVVVVVAMVALLATVGPVADAARREAWGRVFRSWRRAWRGNKHSRDS